MIYEEYVSEKKIKDVNEEEEKREIIVNIIKTKIESFLHPSLNHLMLIYMIKLGQIYIFYITSYLILSIKFSIIFLSFAFFIK